MSQSFPTLIGTVCENIDVKQLYDVEYMGHDSVNRYSCDKIYIYEILSRFVLGVGVVSRCLYVF